MPTPGVIQPHEYSVRGSPSFSLSMRVLWIIGQLSMCLSGAVQPRENNPENRILDYERQKRTTYSEQNEGSDILR